MVMGTGMEFRLVPFSYLRALMGVGVGMVYSYRTSIPPRSMGIPCTWSMEMRERVELHLPAVRQACLTFFRCLVETIFCGIHVDFPTLRLKTMGYQFLKMHWICWEW